jgi:nucleotide-binding universal stress UspA family protein
MFKKVLAATDRVRGRDATVLTAMRIADQNDAQLRIIHVLESGSTKNRDIIKHYQSGEEMLTSTAYEETIKGEITRSFAGLLHENDGCRINVVTGFPWLEITRYAREIDADLIVMGPHSEIAHEKGIVRVAGKIGSSVEGVIMREKCPVMIVNRSIPKERLTFKNILVGIDFSKSCECALMFAAKLAQTYNAKMIIFHMIPVPPDPKYSQADYEADVDAENKRLLDFCSDFLQGIKHEYFIWGGGLPHTEILKCSQDNDTDLIVMGSHTKEKQGKWYAGNAVERVAFRSDCPVIVITDPAVIRPWEDASTSERKNPEL